MVDDNIMNQAMRECFYENRDVCIIDSLEYAAARIRYHSMQIINHLFPLLELDNRG